MDDDWGPVPSGATHFVNALVDGVPAEMSANEAIKALQLCFAVYEAGKTRQAVDPRTIDDVVVPDGWPREGHPDPPPQRERRGKPRGERRLLRRA